MADMTNVMIDLETLGTSPGCAILSVGAVQFGLGGLGLEFYAELHLASVLKAGCLVDARTLAWWVDQSKHDDLIARCTKFGVAPAFVLSEFCDFIDRSGGNQVRVWSNGASFDLPILGSAFKTFGYDDVPWKYYNERCYRTLASQWWPLVPDDIREQPDHNALGDAKRQAAHVVAILRALKDTRGFCM